MTKKLISIVLAVCMLFSIFAIAGVSVQAAEDDTTGTTVYLQPGDWTQAGAWFAAYFFEDGKQETSVKMTPVEGKYMAAVPAGYTNVIFVRMKPDYQEFAWEGRWDQTANLIVQPLGTYTITGFGESNISPGEWSAPAQPGTTATGTTAAQETSAAKVVHVDVTAPGLSGAWRIWTWNDNEEGVWTSLAYGAATVRDNFLMAYFESGVSASDWEIVKEQTNDVVAVDGAYYKILNEKVNEDNKEKYKLVNVSEETTTAAGTTVADTTAEPAEETTAAPASGDAVYLKPGVWDKDNAWFAAYFFVDNTTNKWVRGEEAGDLNKFVIPNDVDYQKVIFCRMAPGSETMAWNTDTETHVWNQTGNLIVQAGKTYEITDWATGQWIDGPVVEPTTAADTTAADTTAADTTETQEPTEADTTAPVATGNTVYLKPNDDWRSNNAWFAAYFFVDDTNVWVRGTEYGDLYKFVIPFGVDYKKVIFVRMNSAATVPGWEQKWNQTANLDIEVGKTYKITDWATGEWIDGPVVEPTTEAQDTTAADTTAPVATGNTVYLKPNDDWRSNNAWFAAYFFVDDTNVWVRGTEYGDLYKFVIPFGVDYKKVIFVRMNSAATVPGWEQKWNQTANLDIEVGKTYKITDWATGEWIDGPVVEPTTEAQDTTAADTTAPVATGNTVYLKPNDDWRSNNAWFAAYFFVDDTNVWVRGTEYGDLYKFVIPFGVDYKKVIFVRMNSAATVPGWEQKWNQTANLDIEVGKTYKITDWATGEWIDGPVEPTTEEPTTAPVSEPIHVANLVPNSYTIVLMSSITMNFYVTPDDVADYDEYWVEVTREGKTDKLSLAGVDPTYHDYIFQYPDILPQQFTDDITAVIHGVKDGQEYYGDEYTRSVSFYINNQITKAKANPTEKNLKWLTVMTDLAVYGGEAQKITGKTEHLVTAGLEDDIELYSSKTLETEDIRDYHYATITNPTIDWKAPTVKMGGAIEIRAYFKPNDGETLDGKYVEVKVLDRTVRYTASDFVYDTNYGEYYFDCDALYAHQLDTPVYFTMYNADGSACTDTMQYSVGSYVNRQMNNNPNGQYTPLITAMMKYGLASKAYGGF